MVIKDIANVSVVWLEIPHRFVLFQKPGFLVYKMIREGISDNEIIQKLTGQFDIDQQCASGFIDGIRDELEKLENVKITGLPWCCSEADPDQSGTQFERSYNLSGTKIKITFNHINFETLILNKIQFLKTETLPPGAYEEFSFQYAGGKFYFRASGQKSSWIRTECFEDMTSVFSMALLSLIYEKTPDSWMGICHASAIAGPAGAVLLTAPSGGGKSTLASLLMASGFELLADDLLPIALDEPEICQFPAAISVKEKSIPVLKEYFPGLEEKASEIPENHPRPQVYLPFPEDLEHGRRAKANAIVFVQYDPAVEYELTLESNLERMEDFLEQIWIPANATSAGRFLDWYFDVPVYTLRYSDNARAIEAMKGLLGDPVIR